MRMWGGALMGSADPTWCEKCQRVHYPFLHSYEAKDDQITLVDRKKFLDELQERLDNRLITIMLKEWEWQILLEAIKESLNEAIISRPD